MATTHDSGDGSPPENPPDQQPADEAPGKPGSGLTRRQLLPAAGGGLAALAVAGFVGYELHPDAKAPAPTPKPTTPPATSPATTLEKPFVSRPDLSPPTVTITQLASGNGRGVNASVHRARPQLRDREQHPVAAGIDAR